MYLSTVPETYNYALSFGINSGLAMVYNNIGAFEDRLEPNKYPKYFAFNNDNGLYHATIRAVEFVYQNAGTNNRNYEISKNVQPNKWYITNYPIVNPK